MLPLALTAVVACMVLYPLAMVIYGSFRDAAPGQPGSFTLANWVRVLGDPGQGFLVAMDFFEVSRPQVAAAAVGVARAAFEHAAAYAREREAFGRPILDRQGVAFKLADMAMEIEAARLLVWRACAAVDAGRDAGLLGSYAKAFAADAAMRATTDAVQVLGGAGVMRDHPVEKWLRDAKVLQVVEGTSEIQRQIVATYLKHGWKERPR